MSLPELLGQRLIQAATQSDVLADLVSSGRLELAPVEDLEREAAPDGLRLDQVADRLRSKLVVGEEDQLGLRLREIEWSHP